MNILHDRIALHTWTLESTPFADFLRVAREAGYNGIELRHVDFLRGQKAGLSEAAMVQQVRDAGLKVAVIGTENGVLFTAGDEFKRRLDSLRYVSDKAVQLGCEVIMVSSGPIADGGMARAKANMKTCAEIVGEYGLRIGAEFNSRHPVLHTLADGMELVEAVNLPNCGILIDTYHLHSGGGNAQTFSDVPLARIIAFQFSDVPPGPPSDAPLPLDRLPPGKGAAPFVDILRMLMAKGYTGYLSYEAPNPALWQRPADEVAREGATLIRELLARAEAAG